MEVSASRLGQPNKNMNRLKQKMYDDRCYLITCWVSRSETYRDTADWSKLLGDEKTYKFYRQRMRYWAVSAAEEIKKLK
jgi:hypothetical protein